MDVIQIHKDALNENDVVLIHDDILATGGTMDAAIQLVKKMGVKTIYVDFILELVGLNGRALLEGKADELNCLFDMEVDE
jgi:adenine phosphoribosyltransferase